ncbi:nodulation protein NfeD [Aequorivita sp. H23M31]|uniref:Nodulation protein NfeD n=1 Tax=Aequorivita ciconiae TaxID=2494375 RepID=A0A410G1F1_9FLAO|nr:nodulation protein NfeD [Aequorivita sp. H23M31]QAA81104.1 nodulation protein NfeD [Aequorivita sp. H23M31]
MKQISLRILFFALSLAISFVGRAQKVILLQLDTPIYPSTADYVSNGLDKAAAENAVCVVIEINTPGGMMDPTREMVGNILNAPIPVISFVTPSSARAGSAGAFIALAANIAAMSPGSNIGASHPILQGAVPDSIMNSKMTEDASAFIRSIAEHRGKDPELIEKMVTNSRSFSAEQALTHNIIDLKADNLADLLKKIDGQTVSLASEKTLVLHTASADVKTMEMGSKLKFLTYLSNPNLMYIFLIMGLMGLFFEFSNPGGLVPGIVGVVCLLLAGYGMSVLPIDFTGLAMIVVGIILFLLEIKFQSYALLSIGGVVCLFLGSVFLIDETQSVDVLHISWTVLISSVVIMSAFFILLVFLGIKAQFGKKKTGSEALVGLKGIAMETLSPEGRVRVNGEFWNAIAKEGTIAAHSDVEVVGVNQFKLIVKSISLIK